MGWKIEMASGEQEKGEPEDGKIENGGKKYGWEVEDAAVPRVYGFFNWMKTHINI